MAPTLSSAFRPIRVHLDDDSELPVRIVGRGEPVLMLPGLGMPSSTWLPFVLPHAGEYQFHLPELRGQGLARDMPLRGPDVFESHADDVAALVDALNLSDFRLVGYSLGATTSLHLMRRGGFFHRVHSYLHIDQSPFVGSDETWHYGLAGPQRGRLVRALGRASFILEAHPQPCSVAELPPRDRAELGACLAEVQTLIGVRPSHARLVERFIARGPSRLLHRSPMPPLPTLRGYLRGYAEGRHDYRSALTQGHTPVTVFAGMRSELYAFEGQRLVADLAEDGTLVRFEGCGHLLPAQAPLRFGRELGRFLTSR